MTEPLLDRAALHDLLSRLGERLVRWGVVGDRYVIGGAAMALAYDAPLTSWWHRSCTRFGAGPAHHAVPLVHAAHFSGRGAAAVRVTAGAVTAVT